MLLRVILPAVVLIALCLPPAAVSAAGCDRLEDPNHYGPFDYRTLTDETRLRVENFHFTREHQRGAMRGQTNEPSVWANLDYTLKAFPNHPRALYLLGLYDFKIKRDEPQFFAQLQRRPYYTPVECYYLRAIRMFPDDPAVYNASGILLSRAGQHDDAIKRFQKAVDLAPESPEAHYNLGLALYAAGRFDEATTSARRAYGLGYPKPALKQKLIRKGHWKN